jgi:tryptophanyl-tRNA synthetase
MSTSTNNDSITKTNDITLTTTKKTKKNKQPYKRFVTNPQRQILSGIQPTGVVHIGNLFGAVSNWVSLQYTEPLLRQEEYLDNIQTQRIALAKNEIQSFSFKPLSHKPVLFTVVDLHAITIPRPANELEDAVRTLTATLLGAGIHPDHATLFIQSHITQHTELAWLLTCNTPVSWLYRMTQFKDKSQKLESKESDSTIVNTITTTNTNTNDEIPLSQLPRGVMAGLLQYPALMAADILLYNATHVPVGDDQTQHLEFSRELARTMNSTFSPIFVEPNPIHNPFATRVMSLRTPDMKMSKSDPSEQGKITLQDSNDHIQKKIKSAVTDGIGGVTYDPKNRPGLANLLNIYAASENMQILTAHHEKIQTQLKNTTLFKQNMLSFDNLSAVSNSSRLYNFALNDINKNIEMNNNDSNSGQFLTNFQTDHFAQALAEYKSITSQVPNLVSPQLLAEKHQNDLLSAFKPAVGDSLVNLLGPIRDQTVRILDDQEYMSSVVNRGADIAREIAMETVKRTKDVMGMRF